MITDVVGLQLSVRTYYYGSGTVGPASAWLCTAMDLSGPIHVRFPSK